jgi:hypothetical protein
VAYLLIVPVAQTAQALDGRIIVKLEGIWKEAVMAKSEALSQHLHGESEENYEKLYSK